ncbi:hypothetical protein D3C84_934430 [compost metagenome]
MLGVEQGEMGQMVAEGLLSVCVNAPPHLGLWRVAGPWDEEPRPARQFPGRYGRLSTREATECLAAGFVTVYSLNPAINIPNASDADLGAEVRQQRSGFATPGVERQRAKAAKHQLWIDTAEEIQAGRARKASKRELARLVKQRLDLHDTVETIRKVIPG